MLNTVHGNGNRSFCNFSQAFKRSDQCAGTRHPYDWLTVANNCHSLFESHCCLLTTVKLQQSTFLQKGHKTVLLRLRHVEM